MPNTPPDFIVRDPNQIVAESIAWYEEQSGKTVYPAQPERLLIDFIAYRETLLREQMQDAALLNLVQFSRAPMLDYLGEFHGEARLSAVAAGCQLQFSVPAPMTTDWPVPTGTLVGASSGAAIVATSDVVVLRAGQSAVSIDAAAIEPGPAGNGWQIGKLSAIISSPAGAPPGLTVTNTTVTAGGADEETDDHYRDRLLIAPEKYSTAGPELAYVFYAKSAHPDIVDVAVISPAPIEVEIYPLMRDGVPPQSVLDAVLAICSARDVRPLSDKVTVKPCAPVDYHINAQLTLLKSADQDTTAQAAQAAAESLAASWGSKLGGEIVDSQVVAALSVPGVHRVKVIGLEEQQLTAGQWRRCQGIEINVTGVVDG